MYLLRQIEAVIFNSNKEVDFEIIWNLSRKVLA